VAGGDPRSSLPLGVFISYRREDSAGHAGRLYDLLAERFGNSRVFIDVDTIGAGEDFFEAIDRAVASCDVLIALIGRHWLNVTDNKGRRRLDIPEDFVRLEIQAALQRGVTVIPVLVQKAEMPSSDDLPQTMGTLARRNAIELSDERFHYDVARLMKALEKLERQKGQGRVEERTHVEPKERDRRRLTAAGWIALLSVVALLGAGLALGMFLLRGDSTVNNSALNGDSGDGESSRRRDSSGGESVLLHPVTVTASITAPPSNDACLNQVPFTADRVSDGDPETAWRTIGDGVGETLTLQFGAPVRVTRVGLIPGYAKVDRCDGTDRFTENRRISRVLYRFSDGSTVPQRLQPTRQVQYVDVDAVTESLSVTIRGTTSHGGRDATPISEIEVYGDPSP
jgi:hypothetical protein